MPNSFKIWGVMCFLLSVSVAFETHAQSVSQTINTAVGSYSVSNASYELDTSNANYEVLIQKEKDSVYLNIKIIKGIPWNTAPASFPGSNQDLLSLYVSVLSEQNPDNVLTVNQVLAGLPPNVVGRFYELEMYQGGNPMIYSLSGYILSKNNWFIDMSVITHSSTKTYASNYLNMVMNSLTINP